MDLHYGNGHEPLLQGHGYSVLDFLVEDALYLVQLRNLWGSKTWRGAWAEESKEWLRFPDVQRHVFRKEHKSAGSVWPGMAQSWGLASTKSHLPSCDLSLRGSRLRLKTRFINTSGKQHKKKKNSRYMKRWGISQISARKKVLFPHSRLRLWRLWAKPWEAEVGSEPLLALPYGCLCTGRFHCWVVAM